MSKIGKLAAYLDGIPIVANTVTRDVLFPTGDIDTNQRVMNLETGYVERYTGNTWVQTIPLGNAGPYFSVKAFGAVVNGSTDDLTAYNDAIAAAVAVGGGIVDIGPGTMAISAAPTAPTGAAVIIRGAGRGVTTIKHKTGGSVLSWTQTHLSSEFGSGIEGVTLDGNSTSSTVATLNGLTLATIRDVVCTNGSGTLGAGSGSGTGLSLVSCWDSHFQSVYVTDCGGGSTPCLSLDTNAVGNDTLNNCTFDDVHVEPTDRDCDYVTFIGNATNEVGDNRYFGLKIHGNPTTGNPGAGHCLLRIGQYARTNEFTSSIFAFGKGTAQIICDGQYNAFFGGSFGIGGAGTPTYAIQCTSNASGNVWYHPRFKTPSSYGSVNQPFRSEAGAQQNGIERAIANFGGLLPVSEAGRSFATWMDTSVNTGYQQYHADGHALAFSPGFVQTTEFINTLTDAATIALNAAAGNAFRVTLGGNRTVGAPTNPKTGQTIRILVIQDGTGGRTLAWNAVFKTAWSDTGNTLNKRSTIQFQYDGTNWNQMGAQSPYI